MRRLNIALGIICQGTNYLLQLRGDDPMIGAAGRIGAFGGKLEQGETAAEAVCRELAEETTLLPAIEDLTYLGELDIISDHRLEDVQVHATVFCLQIDASVKVHPKEGDIVAMTKAEALEQRDRLTPATKVCFERLIV
ncbi:MAG TPA: NUDIX domain-containing protein [Candidatus Saccharimonadales bacterium]|nr:NUDIX domain-containing protein [Candidatus Saccharimonadales bacterium]